MARDRTIQCPHYVAIAGTRRCQSYLDGGGCKREDTFLCTEWLRKNPSQRTPTQAGLTTNTPAAAAPAVSRDLFGMVVRAHPSTAQPAAKQPHSLHAHAPRQDAPPLTRPITEEQIQALEVSGIELCVRSEAESELWLVPQYSDPERNEITFRDAATIAAVCAVFPGAEVTKLEHQSKRGVHT